MTAELIELSRRIRTEIAELGEIRCLVLRRWEKALKDEDYLGSVAFDLHSFYQGIERVFTIIAAARRVLLPLNNQIVDPCYSSGLGYPVIS